MKRMNIILAIGAMSLVGSACYTKHEVIHERSGAAPAKEIVIVEAPPTERVETIGVAPSAEHVWVPGHWVRTSTGWDWRSGRWEVRPTATSVYVPGYWEKQSGGYIWREGHWR